MSRFQLLADSDSGTGHEDLQNLSEKERLNLRERRNDEVEAIQAIYGDDVSVDYDDENGEIDARDRLPYQVIVNFNANSIMLVDARPSTDPPHCSFTSFVFHRAP